MASPTFHNFMTTEPYASNTVCFTTHDNFDPWSSYSPTDHDGRISYYPVPYWPSCFVDGLVNQHPGIFNGLVNRYEARIDIESPIEIVIDAYEGEGEIVVMLTINSADEAVDGDNYNLRCAIVSNEVTGFYTAPNGQSEFHNDLLTYSPDHEGVAFTIDANSTNEYEFYFDYPITLSHGQNDFEVMADNISAIAFVQNDDTEEVIQAEINAVIPDNQLDLSAEPLAPPIVIGPQGGTFHWMPTVVNDTGEDQTFDAWTELTLPNGNNYGPLMIVEDVPIQDGITLSPMLTQFVPGYAFTGEYTFTAKIGDYGVETIDEASFTFEKLAAEGPLVHQNFNLDDWASSGWDEGEYNLLGTPEPDAASPAGFILSEAFPNPFNPTTSVSVDLPESELLKISVFNTNGQEVAELSNGYLNPGIHSFTFNASDLASGIYFIHANVPGRMNEIRKVVLMK